MASVAIAASALLLSFRLPFASFDAAWQANAPRMLCAAALGLGLGASAALRRRARGPLFEPTLFALAIGAVVGLASFAKWIGGVPAVAVGTLLGAALGGGLVRLCAGSRRSSNLLLGFVLALLLVAGLVAALTAATERAGAGLLAAWLLGDLSLASAGLPLLALLLATGIAVACTRLGERAAQAGGVLLFALALGIGGPVAFLGGFAATAVAALVGRGEGERPPVLLCGVVGAALVMAADALPRALIGGYAPALNLAIAVPAVPGFLLWNRRRLRALSTVRASAFFEVFEAALIASIALAIAFVVYALASFARGAT